MSKATFDPTRYSPATAACFQTVLSQRLARRTLIKHGSAMAALCAFPLAAQAGGARPEADKDGAARQCDQSSRLRLGFDSIEGSRLDAVVVPAGYRARVLAPWGTPLNAKAAPWRADGSNTAEDQANAVGMHHDGMHFFPKPGRGDDGMLLINHEYIDQGPLHTAGIAIDSATGRRVSAEEVRKEINAHGVTAVRIRKRKGEWQVVVGDDLNRRYTGASRMAIAGPLAGHPALITAYSKDGRHTRGTLNNCGNGHTPWGTYLTCEENWPDYFVNRGELSVDQIRLGVATTQSRYGWDEVAGDPSERDGEFARFDVSPRGANAAEDFRNEAAGYGYIVEIDPYSCNALPVKRTALGRFRHEGCIFGQVRKGEPVVFYSGHDGRFEYIYKFVSAARWNPRDARAKNPLAVGAKYMDKGTLYVARFNADGSGEWIALNCASATTDGRTLGDFYDDDAAIILNTPGAADLVGATPMDRPEWAALDPITGEIYMTLTNNTRRSEADPANPRIDNANGHIIRWRERESVTAFDWDIFVFGAPAAGEPELNRSGLTDLNEFASPDGLVFDPRGILWIQTDNGGNEVAENTNDQMLAVIPAALGGAAIDGDNQAQLKRFFVGPNGCEVTGLTFNKNHSTFFAGIQHPENWPLSDDATQAPAVGETVRPRAAVVVIEKIEGGPVGL